MLQQRLAGLPLRSWGFDALRLTAAAALAGCAAWGLSTTVQWPSDLIGRGLQVALSGGFGGVLFALCGQALGIAEVVEINQGIARRFSRR